MKTEDFKSLMESFFDEQNITNTMIILMNLYYALCQDAICQIPILLLTRDVSFAINSFGWVPFPDKPTLAISFNRMNRDQITKTKHMLGCIKREKSCVLHDMTIPSVFIKHVDNTYRPKAENVLIAMHQILRGGRRESVRMGHEPKHWNHIVNIIEKRVYDSVLLPSSVLLTVQASVSTFHNHQRSDFKRQKTA